MNRFKILKEEDPFKKNLQGDSRKYRISKTTYRGWLIEPQDRSGLTSIILKIPDNFLKFAIALKNIKIEIECNGRLDIFEGSYVKNSPYNIKGRAHFSGTVSTPF